MNTFVVHFHDENFVGKVLNVTAPSKFAVVDAIVQVKENGYIQDVDVLQVDGRITNAPTYTLEEFKKLLEEQSNGLHVV